MKILRDWGSDRDLWGRGIHQNANTCEQRGKGGESIRTFTHNFF